MSSPWRILSIALLSCTVLLASLQGQALDSAEISGIVRCSAGSLVVDALVAVTGSPAMWAITQRSDSTGQFRFEGLPPGSYAIRVESPGLEAYYRKDLLLAAGAVYRQDVVLRLSNAHLSTSAVRRLTSEPHPSLVGGAARGAEAKSPASEQPLPADRVPPGSTGTVAEMRSDPAASREASSVTGGFMGYTGKHGSNEFHGSMYYLLGNDLLNARGFFGRKAKARSNNFGVFIGGPLKRDRTYFAYHYDRLSTRSGAQSGFGNTSPVTTLRHGDFGSLLGDRIPGVDALGRTLREGQLFDPASTRTVAGTPVRDPFANNRIPRAHPSRSRVAARIVPLLAEPRRQGLEFNAQGTPFGEQVWILDAPSHHARIDHSLVPTVRAALTLSRTSHPAVRNCEGLGGCTVPRNPIESPELNSGYVGTGYYEDITTHHIRQRLEWVATRNLLNQSSITYDEFHVIGHPLSAGAGWPVRLWGGSGNGLPAADAAPPAISFTGNIRYSPMGNEWGRSGFLANHRYGFSDDLTWIRGRHSLKVGVEARHHRYPFRGWANNLAGSFNFHRGHTGGFDADGNNLPSTGDPFASFLLGQVNSTHFQIPDSPNVTENFASWYAMDEYQLHADLTVTLGVRFDYQSALRERDDNMSTFDPNVPNPRAGGRLGAMIFAGTGPGRTGSRTLESPPRDAFGPRIGLAYRLGGRNVVRGSYAIYYATVPHAHFETVNTLGFRFHATEIDLTNGQRPVYFLDDGFPQSSIVMPPAIDPAVGNSTSPVAITKDRAKLPRVQDWSLAIQRQVTRSTALDIAYNGNRGSRLVTDHRVLGPAANANAPAILGLGPSVLATRAGSGMAGGAGVPMPFAGFQESVAQALRPFPHMLGIGYMHVPAGNSFYHALRAKLERRFSDGGHLRAAYEWSKLTGMGAGIVTSVDGLDHGPQNPTDTHSLERGLSADDVPHRLQASFTHAVPVFRDRKAGLAAKVLGGWAFSGIVRIQAGTPVNVVMANDLEPFLFNGQKRPDIVSDRVRIDRGRDFDAATHAAFDRKAFADPGPLRFGNASRTMDFVRGFTGVTEDFSLFKDTWINQKFKVRFETQFANLFNRVVFCHPNRNWSAASFGRVYAQCNSPRTIQFGLRMDF